MPPHKISFFDAKPYDIKSFNALNKTFHYDITYFDARLRPETVDLASGTDAVCVFVNDVINRTSSPCIVP